MTTPTRFTGLVGIVVACSISVCMPIGALAAQRVFRSATTSLQDIEDNLDEVRTRVRAFPAERRMTDSMRSGLRGYRTGVARLSPGQLQPDYLENLDLLAGRSARLASDSSMGSVSDAIRILEADLSAKSSYQSTMSTMSREAPPLITITLSTFRDTAEVRGLHVSADPALFTDAENPAYPFNSTSSPTQVMLPPGMYCIFIRDADRKLLTSKPMIIGLAGVPNEVVRIDLPGT